MDLAQKNTDRKLKVGVLGCGPISQFTHFESCQKANNVELTAICDLAPDLLTRMALLWQPQTSYSDHQQMLADPEVEAVIIATADEFHVPLALQAVRAGKHVLIEKPLSHSLEECLELMEAVDKAGVYVQVGHMKRFDPGIEYAVDFISEKIGEILALKAWYGDHTHRYTMTDNVQPLPYLSNHARKSNKDPKANLARYYLMAHGSHLIDTAQVLGGAIGSLQTSFKKKAGAHCWFVSVEFVNGALGHLDLTIKIRGDWHEGFTIYGEQGSIYAKTHNPWFYKTSEVECYYEPEQQFFRPLGADGFSYRRQLEHFADVILKGVSPRGCGVAEGMNITKVMIAIRLSLESKRKVYMDEITTGAI